MNQILDGYKSFLIGRGGNDTKIIGIIDEIKKAFKNNKNKVIKLNTDIKEKTTEGKNLYELNTLFNAIINGDLSGNALDFLYMTIIKDYENKKSERDKKILGEIPTIQDLLRSQEQNQTETNLENTQQEIQTEGFSEQSQGQTLEDSENFTDNISDNNSQNTITNDTQEAKMRQESLKQKIISNPIYKF